MYVGDLSARNWMSYRFGRLRGSYFSVVIQMAVLYDRDGI